jgi:hypothetical protein
MQTGYSPRRRFDAIALAYGLCGGGVSGIRAMQPPHHHPAHNDCIGILLGSQARYLRRSPLSRRIIGSAPAAGIGGYPCPERYSEKLAQYTSSSARTTRGI